MRFFKSSEDKNIKIGVIFSYITLVLGLLVNLFFTPYVLEKVGDKHYGIMSFVLSMSSWMTILTSSLGIAYTRFATIETKNNGNPNVITTIYFKIFLIIALVLGFISSLLIVLYHFDIIKIDIYGPEEKNIIITIFSISVIETLSGIIVSVFNLYPLYIKKFIFVRFLPIMAIILDTLLKFAVLFLGFGIVEFVAVHSSVQIFVYIIPIFYSFKHGIGFAKTKLIYNKMLVKQIFVFCSYIILNTVVYQINTYVDRSLLGIFISAESVTIYSLGQTFSLYTATMSQSFSNNYIPRINDYAVENKKDEINNLFSKLSNIQTFVVLMILGGFATCGKDFVRAWLGEDKDIVFYVALILLFINSMPLCEYSSTEIQRALNKHKFRAILYISVALFNIILSIILLKFIDKKYAIYCCLIGSACAIFIGDWIIINVYNKKVLKLPIFRFLLNYLFVFVIAGLSSLLSYYISNLIIGTENYSYWIMFIIKGFMFALFFVLIYSLYKIRDVINLFKGKRHERKTI